MGNYSIFELFENPRRGRQARNLTTNVPKILDLKSSSEQIFSKNRRWVPLFIAVRFFSQIRRVLSHSGHFRSHFYRMLIIDWFIQEWPVRNIVSQFFAKNVLFRQTWVPMCSTTSSRVRIVIAQQKYYKFFYGNFSDRYLGHEKSNKNT